MIFDVLILLWLLMFLRKEKTKRRVPKNDRDLSGQKPLIFHGVSCGDKSDASFFHGKSVDNPWIIHGSSMEHGLSMDYPWIVHRFSGGSPSDDPFSYFRVSLARLFLIATFS